MNNSKLKSLLAKAAQEETSAESDDLLISLNDSLAKNLLGVYGSSNQLCYNNSTCTDNTSCSDNTSCTGNGTCNSNCSGGTSN